MINQTNERLEPGGRARIQREFFGEHLRISNGTLARFTLTSPATIRRLCEKGVIPYATQTEGGKHWIFRKGRKFWNWAWRKRLDRLNRRRRKALRKERARREPSLPDVCPDWLREAIDYSSGILTEIKDMPVESAATLVACAEPLFCYLDGLRERATRADRSN